MIRRIHMLFESVKSALEKKQFLPLAAFHPFPKASERPAWESLGDEAKNAVLQNAHKYKGRVFETLPATMYMEFIENGNRSRYEGIYFERRRALLAMVLAECIESKGTYLPDIFNLIWAICEESSWVIPAHNRVRSKNFSEIELPDATEEIYIDLFSAETGSLLCWCGYLLKEPLDSLSPILRRRIHLEIEKRLFAPFLACNDLWWMGLAGDRPVNNWNPWINENLLACTLLEEKDGKTREQLLLKIAASADRFLFFYAPDGGCDEGPGYFNVAGGSVLDILELLLLATNGQLSLYHEPLIQNMAKYIMNVYIGGSCYINFADADARLTPDAYMLNRAAVRMKDASLESFSGYLIENKLSVNAWDIDYSVIHRRIANLLMPAPPKSSSPYMLPLSHAFPGIEICFARERADGSGLYFAAKGGHNNESHNHNDAGNFLVYVNGEAALCDIGVETYRKETFNEKRYTIWTMQSCYHNTAVLNGFDQKNGFEYAARDFSFSDRGDKAVYICDIAGAYPQDAGVKQYLRTITLERAFGKITVNDRYALGFVHAPIRLPLLCAQEPEIASGTIKIPSASSGIEIRFDPDCFSASREELPLTDSRLLNTWKRSRLYRVLLTQKTPHPEGEFTLEILKI